MLRSVLLITLALLAACTTPPAAEIAPAPPPPPSGMEQLLGQPAATALQMLGSPHLDKREGPARQLQFAGSCILDLWYYSSNQSPAVATHADARLPDGKRMAPGACLRQLRQDRAVKNAAAEAQSPATPQRPHPKQRPTAKPRR